MVSVQIWSKGGALLLSFKGGVFSDGEKVCLHAFDNSIDLSPYGEMITDTKCHIDLKKYNFIVYIPSK